MKVAIIHDYLTQLGGAEKVLKCLASLYPEAPIYTLIYDKKAMGDEFAGRDIRVSFLNSWIFPKRFYRYFSWLMPLAVEQFDLSGYDLVISSSAGYAKGVIIHPGTLHICYLHSPVRYAWDPSFSKNGGFNILRRIKIFSDILIHYIRIWDRQASSRVDYFVTNSNFIAQKIKKYYQRDAKVIYPPVDTDFFNLGKESSDKEKYFLVVSRFLPYKKIDLVIEAFKKNGINLKIVGDGPQKKYLKKISHSSKNIFFEGSVSQEKLRAFYQNAQALIFPQVEDFGIVAAEAIACGAPVLAYKKGGALEIVEKGISGMFFDEQTPESINECIEKFFQTKFDKEKIRKSALKFSEENFLKNIKNFVEKIYENRN
jgi:glycosyltransferase involved in cell wall biosynthesis